MKKKLTLENLRLFLEGIKNKLSFNKTLNNLVYRLKGTCESTGDNKYYLFDIEDSNNNKSETNSRYLYKITGTIVYKKGNTNKKCIVKLDNWITSSICGIKSLDNSLYYITTSFFGDVFAYSNSSETGCGYGVGNISNIASMFDIIFIRTSLTTNKVFLHLKTQGIAIVDLTLQKFTTISDGNGYHNLSIPVSNLLNQKSINAVISPWTSPITLVDKSLITVDGVTYPLTKTTLFKSPTVSYKYDNYTLNGTDIDNCLSVYDITSGTYIMGS